MKKSKLFLMACAAVALGMAFLPNWGTGILGALALPFSALGWGLRKLSLAGVAGNVLAWVIYGGVCLIPGLVWLRSRRKGEDALLPVLSVVLAMSMYYMINPNLRLGYWQNETGDLVYALPVWSVLVAWGVMRLVVTGELLERNIYRALRIFLILCAAASILDCLGTELRNLRWYLEFYAGRWATLLIVLTRYMARLAEGLLTALVLCKGGELLDALEADPFSAECVEAAKTVSNRCRHALAVMTLSSAFVNVAQLLMHGMLVDVQMELTLPVMGVAVCFAMLAVTKLLVRGKELQDDNDLFV